MIDAGFLAELADDMRDNGVDDEIFIQETIAAIKENTEKGVCCYEIKINSVPKKGMD